jgi:hypothetical protein
MASVEVHKRTFRGKDDVALRLRRQVGDVSRTGVSSLLAR